jgi:serine/threonine-protein kinase RsbW
MTPARFPKGTCATDMFLSDVPEASETVSPVYTGIAIPMAEPPPNVWLCLDGAPENVVLAREALAGVAEAIGLDECDFDDIRTAVTEACNNVVQHAYGNERGPLEIEVRVAPDALEVVVSDRGDGFQAPFRDVDDGTRGIGFHVIETLARRVDIRDAKHGGTEVRMEFAAHCTSPLDADTRTASQREPLTPVLTQAPWATVVSVAPARLARTVLPRLMSALAARAHFSTDRISDAQILADALVAHAPSAIVGDGLSVGICVAPRDLELHIAPLRAGRAQQLIGDSNLDGLGRVIEKLTDRHRVSVAGPYETLMLGLIDRR